MDFMSASCWQQRYVCNNACYRGKQYYCCNVLPGTCYRSTTSKQTFTIIGVDALGRILTRFWTSTLMSACGSKVGVASYLFAHNSTYLGAIRLCLIRNCKILRKEMRSLRIFNNKGLCGKSDTMNVVITLNKHGAPFEVILGSYI